jgi:hypothetical protein
VTGPSFFNQGQPYRVTVACTGYTAKTSVIIEVAVRTSDKAQKLVQVSKNVTLSKSGSQIVELNVSFDDFISFESIFQSKSFDRQKTFPLEVTTLKLLARLRH